MSFAKSLPRIAAFVLLSACVATAPPGPETTRNAPVELSMPAMKTFGTGGTMRTGRANASIAQQFTKLAFDLESGRQLPVFSRFEEPVTVRLTGMALRQVNQRDLDRLLARLRSEAGIRITRAAGNGPANITIEVLRKSELQRTVPQAACFVAPRISSWAEFKSRRNSAAVDWTTLTERTKMAIFLPGDVSAQEVRDCLHEEIAQALGPVNDLYHLTDSVFNDDNFHTVLTGFDMMILRAFYDGALENGMSRDAVSARILGILNRINPAGRSGGFAGSVFTPPEWINAIESSLVSRGLGSARLTAARRAVLIARQQGWRDNRLAFSLYAQGRLALPVDPNLALASFSEAEAIFRADPNTDLHAAHVAVQGAAYALSARRPSDAISIADKYAPIAQRAQNAALLSTYLMMKADALDALGRTDEATAVRRDALGWAQYGFANENEIRARLREIRALSPRINGSPS